MTGKRTSALGLVGITCALALAACGGGGGGEGLPKSEFVAKGNAACASSNDRIAESAKSQFTDKGIIPSPDKVGSFGGKTFAPEMTRQLDALNDLKAPSAERDEVHRIIRTGRRAVEITRNDPTVIYSRDQDPFKLYDQLATDFGLNECASSSVKVHALVSGITKP